MRIEGPEERIRAELTGRLAGHPACPRLLESGPDWMTLEPLGGPVEDPLAALLGWPEGVRTRVRGSLGEWLGW